MCGASRVWTNVFTDLDFLSAPGVDEAGVALDDMPEEHPARVRLAEVASVSPGPPK